MLCSYPEVIKANKQRKISVNRALSSCSLIEPQIARQTKKLHKNPFQKRLLAGKRSFVSFIVSMKNRISELAEQDNVYMVEKIIVPRIFAKYPILRVLRISIRGAFFLIYVYPKMNTLPVNNSSLKVWTRIKPIANEIPENIL